MQTLNSAFHEDASKALPGTVTVPCEASNNKSFSRQYILSDLTDLKANFYTLLLQHLLTWPYSGKGQSSSGSGGGQGGHDPPGPIKINHKKGGHIDFMFLSPPFIRLLDPLLQSSSVTITSTCKILFMIFPKIYILFLSDLSDLLIVKNEIILKMWACVVEFVVLIQTYLYCTFQQAKH